MQSCVRNIRIRRDVCGNMFLNIYIYIGFGYSEINKKTKKALFGKPSVIHFKVRKKNEFFTLQIYRYWVIFCAKHRLLLRNTRIRKRINSSISTDVIRK